MNRLLSFSPPLLAIAVSVAGCASKATMDTRYDASLQRWRGATRADLEAAWGRPTLASQAPDGQVLTWIVRVDMDDRATPGAPPTPVVVTSRTAGGGVSVSTATPSLSASATVPITCTTHFTLKDGRVASWTFEGLGCGAPT